MRILIVGNQGYIGPVMTRLAKEWGHQVTGLDVGYFRDNIPNTQKDIPADKQIIRDVRDIRLEDLKNIDAIIHLAGLSNDPMGELNPNLTYDINLHATIKLGELAKQAGIGRFIFASSCSIYGAADITKPLDETAKQNPVSAYAISKVKSEEGLAKLADKNFSPVYMRNATVYGVSPRMRFDLVLNNLMGWAFTASVIKVMSDGTPWRPLVHIEDFSRGALAAAAAPRDAVHDQAFNIGRVDCNYQVKDIAQAVTRRFPQAKLDITGETGGDPRSYKVDFTKALTKLPGFKPEWTLDMGAEEIDKWLKAGALKDDKFDSRVFIRLKQLKHLMEQRLVDRDLHFVDKKSAASG